MNTLTAINDLNRHTKPLAEEIKNRLSAVVDSGWFILGKEVNSFESSFAKYCGASHCISVANGTEALEIALRALDIGHGCTVATVANAGMYSATAIAATGALPVFIDIDNTSLTMSPDDLQRNLNAHKIDAIIVTHLYGQLAAIEKIISLAKQHGIPVIEDCAQAHGAQRNGIRAGSFGDIGCFSFYPTKNLGALGDGGAIVTNNQQLKERVTLIRQYGWSKKYYVVKSGCKNSRLDEMQAAILNVKLPFLDQWNLRRREIVKATINNCGKLKNIEFPKNTDDTYVGHLFVVRSQYRNKLKEFLHTKSVACDIHYPIPDYRQSVYLDRYAGLFLINTEKAAEEILTLPCFPEMTDDEVQYLSEALIAFDNLCSSQ